MNKEEKRLNLGIKARIKITFIELLIKFIELFYTLVIILLWFFCFPFMIFSQKHFDEMLEVLKRKIGDYK